MISVIAGLVLALGAPPVNDTVLELRRGDRIVLSNLTGHVSVRAWAQDRLQVGTDDPSDQLQIVRVGGVVNVEPTGRRGPRHVDAVLRLPAWAELEITGLSLDVDVGGLEGSLRIQNVEGDVDVRAGSGTVEIHTIEGRIDVQDVEGRVSVSSQAGDVTLVGVAGWVEVASGSGDLTLERIRATTVRVETQEGDVSFDGDVLAGGNYSFYVHDGDARIAVPDDIGAEVRVSTFDGEFTSEFPVVIERFRGGRQFSFTLGNGDARLQIEVFDGEIQLVKRR